MTHGQIAEYCGVTRAAVSVQVMHAGLSKPRPRYDVELPWRVRTEHITAYPARMLRLLGRKRQGGSLTGKEEAQLQSWLTGLQQHRLIVGYDPDDDAGFHYIDAGFHDHEMQALPIRRAPISLSCAADD